MADNTRQACEKAARDNYGRLLALLSSRSRDIAASEDALSDAFAAALEHWPTDGIPDNPAAWLLTAARRRTLDHWRHTRVQEEAAQALVLIADELRWDADDAHHVPDERLRLLFVCAHPAVQEAARAPLMLQTVLGLDVARMAAAFLTAPATLSQRLVRAKQRIRDTGIPFEFPHARDLPQRLADVLDGIYAAYGTGWDDVEGADPQRQGLTRDAIELCRILCALMPREPEPRGLLALMLFCEARRDARRGPQGSYVPLAEQDARLWNSDMLREAETQLLFAAATGAPGAFQIEAAIQSAHTQRRLGADVPPEALVTLYDALQALRPGAAVAVGRACALGTANGPQAAIDALRAFARAQTPGAVDGYQPYWAALAHWLAQSGDASAADDAQDARDAQHAYERAIGLASSAAVRDFLRARQYENLRH